MGAVRPTRGLPGTWAQTWAGMQGIPVLKARTPAMAGGTALLTPVVALAGTMTLRRRVPKPGSLRQRLRLGGGAKRTPGTLPPGMECGTSAARATLEPASECTGM